MKINICNVQFSISSSIKENLQFISEVIQSASPEDIFVFPECSLSGYSESDADFPLSVAYDQIESSIEEIKQLVEKKVCHILFGTLRKRASKIYNCGILISHSNSPFIYEKVNLAINERRHITAGSKLSGTKLVISGKVVNVAIQLCRELRFPEQWKHLALTGTEVFFYLTYTTGEAIDIWRSHLVSRAAENQRYVIASNVASEKQQCPTMIIDPAGKVISEIRSSEVNISREQIDLDRISNWYLEQSRKDLVGIYKGTAS